MELSNKMKMNIVLLSILILQIVEPYYSKIRNKASKLLKKCEEGFEHTRDDRDCSVYTGTGGRITLFYLFITI